MLYEVITAYPGHALNRPRSTRPGLSGGCFGVRHGRPSSDSVITSYSIHYTKLYDKDKARLLVGLRTAMGIEAYPALVNTDSGEFLPDALPSMQLVRADQ